MKLILNSKNRNLFILVFLILLIGIAIIIPMNQKTKAVVVGSQCTCGTEDFWQNTSQGPCYWECTQCGKKWADHPLITDWTPNGSSGHKKTCRTCGAVVATAQHNLTNYTKSGNGHIASCPTCGYTTGVLAHSSVSTSYQSNEAQHYKICDYCHETFDLSIHEWSQFVDAGNGLQHVSTCSVCGKVGMQPHEPSVAYGYDNDNHYNVCKDCKGIYNGSPHVWINYKDYGDGIKHIMECSVCKVKATQNHVLSEEWKTEGNKHYKLCTLCNTKVQEAEHTPGTEWKTEGNKHYKVCTVCNTKMQEAEHTVGTEWKIEGNKHYKICTVCNAKVQEAEHTPGTEWKTNSSSHWKECTVCKMQLELASHSGTSGYDNQYHWTGCSTCSYGSNNKQPHDMKEQRRVEAKCGVAGTIYRKCSGCDYTDTVAIPALSHNWKDATCVSPKTCTLCGVTEGSPLGHNYVIEHNQNNHWKECTRCGAEEQGSRSAHSWVNGNCSVCGEAEQVEECIHTYEQRYNDVKHWKQCTKCGDRIEEENHTNQIKYDDIQHWKECTKCEYKSSKVNHNYDENGKCSDCGKIKIIEQCEHTYQKKYNDTYHWDECTKCGDKQNIEKHNFINGKCSKCGKVEQIQECEHTYEQKSNNTYHWYECTKCGDKKNIEKHNFKNGECSDCKRKDESITDKVIPQTGQTFTTIIGILTSIGASVGTFIRWKNV